MAISQMALIQSLGDAMAWFERELAWGIPATELRHLCGRIGELFVAVITNGQMATEINQKGYDVVSSTNERISVKTTATVGSANNVMFNTKTLGVVDRVIVLRINTEEREIETLLDVPVAKALEMMGPESRGKRSIALSKLVLKTKDHRKAKAILEVRRGIYAIRELENGSIEVEKNGMLVRTVKPILRELAAQMNIGILNASGNPYNTRQLGSRIIKNIQELEMT